MSTLCLSGCLGVFDLKQMTDQSTQADQVVVKHKMTSREAVWSKFMGYSPEAHAVRLSTVIEESKLLIVQQAKQISALYLDTGVHCWKAKTSYTLTNPATNNKKMIFLTTSEPRVLALKATTGVVAWSVALPNIVFATAYSDDQQVILKTVMGEIIALNAKNGKLLWRYQYPHNISITLHNSSAPIVHNNQVFVGFPDSKLLILERTSGTKIAEHAITQPRKLRTDFQLSQFSDIATDPVIDIDDNKLYINAYQNKLQTLSLVNREVIWERSISSCNPIVIGKHAYLLDNQNVIYALDKQDGRTIWKQTALNDQQLVGPALLVQQNKIIVADQEGNIYWLSTDNGEILSKASFDVPSPILNAPLVKENTVYAITRKGKVAAWVDQTA